MFGHNSVVKFDSILKSEGVSELFLSCWLMTYSERIAPLIISVNDHGIWISPSGMEGYKFTTNNTSYP